MPDAPGQDPLQPTTRRLVAFTYLCPLCEDQHRSEYYITVPANTLSDLVALVDTFANSDAIFELIVQMAMGLHHQEGNLDQLRQQLPGRQVALGLLDHEILDESDYTCDECSATFPTIEDFYIHYGTAGSPPHYNGAVPLCQRPRG